MNYPETLRYTSDHEWVRLEGDVAVVGITDFAQDQLGDVVYLDIPSVGKDLAEHAVFGSVEAVKTVSDLFLPIAGTVLEINPALKNQPELVNKDPYGDGWLIKLKPTNAADVEKLLTAAAYQAQLS